MVKYSKQVAALAAAIPLWGSMTPEEKDGLVEGFRKNIAASLKVRSRNRGLPLPTDVVCFASIVRHRWATSVLCGSKLRLKLRGHRRSP